jgi:AcrR family transcriptional regulator
VVTQTERRNSTRCAIVKAAFDAFKKAGSADVALELIAENAGMTKGSIHYHFKNRVGLVMAVAIWVF